MIDIARFGKRGLLCFPVGCGVEPEFLPGRNQKDGEIGHPAEPVEVKENDKGNDPQRSHERQHHRERERGPHERPRDHLKEAVLLPVGEFHTPLEVYRRRIKLN